MKKPIVIVTGAGTGIGAAVAKKFINEGWRVVGIARRSGPLESMRFLLGSDFNYFTLDLARPDIAKELTLQIEKIETSWNFSSNFKALINNAGIYRPQSFLNSSEQEWKEQFDVNFFSIVRTCKALLPYLIKNSEGVIVNVSSTLAHRPILNTCGYSASKAALNNFTLGLALEMAPYKIRVNAVCPGIIDTPIHQFENSPEGAEQAKANVAPLQPLGRIGLPEEVAHSIFHFCAPGSEWTTGSLLTVDGGIQLL